MGRVGFMVRTMFSDRNFVPGSTKICWSRNLSYLAKWQWPWYYPIQISFYSLNLFLCSSCVFIKDRQRFVSFHRLTDRIEPASTIPAGLWSQGSYNRLILYRHLKGLETQWAPTIGSSHNKLSSVFSFVMCQEGWSKEWLLFSCAHEYIKTDFEEVLKGNQRIIKLSVWVKRHEYTGLE